MRTYPGAERKLSSELHYSGVSRRGYTTEREWGAYLNCSNSGSAFSSFASSSVNPEYRFT